ncbi:MATE efflux family [Micractinium conductrix]|uniref:Protein DETOXIFICATION n=1 Tax=Micractinium conductrix TaxID=554055 RepID=A0A2P6V7M2_9CHLO|nr:MATE efflux family [Micractinium conductrix]|eukprot:PSC70081.1 MATE efflux family [Micractinium conductrix]
MLTVGSAPGLGAALPITTASAAAAAAGVGSLQEGLEKEEEEEDTRGGDELDEGFVFDSPFASNAPSPAPEEADHSGSASPPPPPPPLPLPHLSPVQQQLLGAAEGAAAVESTLVGAGHARPRRHTSEARRILRLAAPLTISNVGGYAIGMVAMAAVGHLGQAALSVTVLATSLYNMTGLACLVGFASTMETFCGQAYGAGSYRMVGLVLQRALLLTTLLCAVVFGVWTQMERILLALGQDPIISHGCAQFLIRAAPALWFTAVFESLKRYLMAQEVVRPVTASTVAALAAAPLYNWLLIYRLGWGLHGAAYAMVAVQATTAALLTGYTALRDVRMRRSAHPRCTWGGWSRKALAGWPQYLRLALPSVAMLACECSMFQVMVVMAGWLPQPDVAVSAMGIVINTSGLAYMAVTGFACAVSVRVGYSLGAGQPWAAKRATWTAWALTMCLQVVVATTVVSCRHGWAKVFTNSEPVIEGVSSLLPIFAISLFGDGTSAVLQGLLRGGGKQAIGAVTNVSSYWGVGIPLAYYLAFPRGLGLQGLWWGLACTNTMQGCIMATLSLLFNFPNEARRAVAKAQAEAARAEAQRAAKAAAAALVAEAGMHGSGLQEPLLDP